MTSPIPPDRSWTRPTDTPPESREVGEALAPGQLIDRFELRRELGAGSYGRVWLAWDPSQQREVALKILRRTAAISADRRERFHREARIAQRLSHPNLCACYAEGEHQGQLWLAMEYVPGEDLAGCLRNRKAQPPDRSAMRPWVDLIRQLALALHHAHAHRLVHRDVKPGNVIVAPDGTAKLVDFGAAHDMDQVEQLTRGGMVLGTPFYMPPEQWAGAPVDARADVFALGVILYECLTGQLPFEAVTEADHVAALERHETVDVRRHRSDLDEDLQLVLRTALAPERQDRYADAAKLATDLDLWMQGLRVSVRRPGTLRRAMRWVERNRAVSGLGALLAIATISASWFAWSARQAWQDERRARDAELAQQAGRIFDTGLLRASTGDWGPAESAFNEAEQLGFDKVACELERIQVWDAAQHIDKARVALERLHEQADLGFHAALVEVLWLDPSRFEGGLPSGWREDLRTASEQPTVSAAWREYALACAAETLPQARQHLATALRHDNRHRPAQELDLSLDLLVSGPEIALAKAKQFEAIWPHDTYGRMVQAIALQMLGLEDQAARALAEPGLAKSNARLSFFAGLQRQSKAMLEKQVEVACRMALGDTGESPGPGLQSLVAVATMMWKTLGMLNQSMAETGFRVPRGAISRGDIERAILSAMKSKESSYSDRWLQAAQAIYDATHIPSALQAIAVGQTILGRLEQGTADFAAAMARPPGFIDLRHELHMLQTLALYAQAAKRFYPPYPTMPIDGHLRDQILTLLRSTTTPSRTELRLLCNAAALLGDRWLTAECVARLMQSPLAGYAERSTASETAAFAGLDGLARELNDEILQDQPGDLRANQQAERLRTGKPALFFSPHRAGEMPRR